MAKPLLSLRILVDQEHMNPVLHYGVLDRRSDHLPLNVKQKIDTLLLSDRRLMMFSVSESFLRESFLEASHGLNKDGIEIILKNKFLSQKLNSESIYQSYKILLKSDGDMARQIATAIFQFTLTRPHLMPSLLPLLKIAVKFYDYKLTIQVMQVDVLVRSIFQDEYASVMREALRNTMTLDKLNYMNHVFSFTNLPLLALKIGSDNLRSIMKGLSATIKKSELQSVEGPRENVALEDVADRSSRSVRRLPPNTALPIRKILRYGRIRTLPPSPPRFPGVSGRRLVPGPLHVRL
jgi:hypothetical protein